MVRHIVIWKLAEHFSQKEKDAHTATIKAGLERLPSLMDCVVSLKVVVNPLASSNMDIMLDTLFETEADLETYQMHPEHQKVAEFVRSVISTRACMDFHE